MGIGTYTFEVDGEMITFFRSPKGSYSGKFNRMVKLAKLFTGLDSMMGRIAKRGRTCNTERPAGVCVPADATYGHPHRERIFGGRIHDNRKPL